MRDRLDALKMAAAEIAWDVREKGVQGREELAWCLHLVRETRRWLGDAERLLEASLAAELDGEKTAVVAGLGTIERKASRVKPVWDHAALMDRVAAASQDERKIDTETGEVLESFGQAAVRVMFDCAAIGYWRVGKLAERGIDAKAFCEQEGWRETVRVVPEQGLSLPLDGAQ